jgi:hypothetical protein
MASKYLTWAQAHPQADPFGPGSPAWEEMDFAIIHYINGRPRQGGAAVSRMKRHLKFANAPLPLILNWMMRIEARIKYPEPDDFDNITLEANQ